MLKDAIDLGKVKRVLVIMLRHHGDVLLTSPVFSSLAAAIDGVEIDALIYKETEPMLANHPSISQLHLIDRQAKKCGIIKRFKIEKAQYNQLKARQYDLIIHLCAHWRGCWLTALLKPRYAVSIDRPRRIWRRVFRRRYDDNIAGRHRVERNLDALRRLGIQPVKKDLVLGIDQETQTTVDAQFKQHQLSEKNYILIHPGSRWMFKCWPENKFAELIDRLTTYDMPIVLTGAPDDVEKAFIYRICNQTKTPVIDLSGQLTLKELAGFIAQARLFIGVDSAPMHMASAFKTPTVVLFGPTDFLEWGPWKNTHNIVFSEQFSCRPCGKDGCGGSKISDCLTHIPVDKVLDAVSTLLTESNEKRAS